MITNKPRQSLWSLFSPYSSKDSLDLKVGSAVMLMEGIWQDNIPPCLVMITLDTGSANMFSNLNSLVSAEKKYNQEPCRLKKWARSHKVRTDLNQIIIFSEVCKIKYFLNGFVCLCTSRLTGETAVMGSLEMQIRQERLILPGTRKGSAKTFCDGSEPEV